MTTFQFYCLSTIGLGLMALDRSDAFATAAKASDDKLLVILTDSPQDPWDPAFEPRHELYKEKLKSFMQATGLPYTVRRVSWSRAISSAQVDDNVLFYALMRVPSREDKFHWILPLTKSDFYLVGRSNASTSNLPKAEVVSGKYSVICEAFSVECDLASEFGFPAAQILKPFGTDLQDRLSLVRVGRVDFAIAQRTRHSDGEMSRVADDDQLVSVMPMKSQLSNYLAAGQNLKAAYLKVLTATSLEFQAAN